jgi:hypothetical protein
MIGVGRGGQIVGDADTGQLEIFNGLLSKQLFGGFLLVPGRAFFDFGGFDDLRFYVFAFPTPCHINILTQFVGIGRFLSGNVSRKKLVSGLRESMLAALRAPTAAEAILILR